MNRLFAIYFRFHVYCIILLLASGQFVSAQQILQIDGNFLEAKEKDIRLMGFMGTNDTLLCQTKSDASGNFRLFYPGKYCGAAVIQVKELANLLVILNHESFTINWSDFKEVTKVQFLGSNENQVFLQGYEINADVQKKMSALSYLLPLYEKEPNKEVWTSQLKAEIDYESNRLEDFLSLISNQLYVKAYIKYLNILQKMQSENKTEQEVLAAENSFLTLDFGSKELFYSGLAKISFDEFFKQLLSGNTKEIIIKKSKALSDSIKHGAKGNSMILNEYSEYLIKQYEKYGISEAAEYLALSLLHDNKCSMDTKRISLLEQYQKMAIGNVAPNLLFPNNAKYKSLTDVQAKYKVIVFGASWCEACQKEIPQLKEYSEPFKSKYNTEILFVSIDTDNKSYTEFTKELPFISLCDFKGWEGENVKNYYVFATPTFYIVDENNRIVGKPLDAIGVASWLYNNAKIDDN